MLNKGPCLRRAADAEVKDETDLRVLVAKLSVRIEADERPGFSSVKQDTSNGQRGSGLRFK